MNWFRHNFIADMPGPHFLLFYGGVILGVLALCWVRVRHFNTNSTLAPPPIPTQPDPYAVAYLRGGTSEVARLVIFALLERGFLQVTQEPHRMWQNPRPQKFERTDFLAPTTQLPVIEQSALSWFNRPRLVAEVFNGTGNLSAVLEDECADYERQLRQEQLLSTPDSVGSAQRIGLWGALAIFSVGGYKLFDAYLEGRSNVGFLIVMSFLAAFLLAGVCRQDRLSARGRAYLSQLQLAFERLKSQAVLNGAPRGTVGHTAQAAQALNSGLMLVVGVFGVTALSGTAFAYYPQLFPQATSSGDGGGCGGGSSCGGGGCGGGGCGGGGCGGG